MKKRNLIQNAIVLLMLGMVTLAGLTACTASYDNPVETIDNQPTDGKNLKGILGNRIIHVVNADSLDNYKLPLEITEKLDITLYDSSETYGVTQQDAGDKSYLAFTTKKDPEPGIETIRMKVAPKGNPDKARLCLLVFYKPRHTNMTRASINDAKWEKFKTYLGHGHYNFNGLTYGAGMSNVLNIDRLDTLSQADFATYFNSTTGSAAKYWSRTGYGMEQTSSHWSFDIGLSYKHTFNKRNALLGLKNNKWMLSTDLSVAVSKTESHEDSYEYYLAMARKSAAFAKIYMNRFEKENNAGNLKNDFKVLCAMLDQSFVNNLLSADMESYNIIKSVGTDVITQADFGGYFYYLYGRQQNAYSSSVGCDLNASVGLTDRSEAPAGQQPVVKTLGQALMAYLAAQTKNKISGSVGFEGEWSNYQEASKAFTLSGSLGGDGSVSTLEAWDASIKESNPDSWTLISFTNESRENSNYDEDKDDEFLYPLHKLAQDFLDGWKASFSGIEIPEGTKAQLDFLEKRIKTLEEAREQFMWDNAYEKAEHKIIVADFVARQLEDSHGDDAAKPFIAESYDGVKRIYYPVMANDYAPYSENLNKWNKNKNGYILEVTAEPWWDGRDNCDETFFYALDVQKTQSNEKGCWGIVDMCFAKDKDQVIEKLSDKSHNQKDNWVKSSWADNSNIGASGDDGSNYIWLYKKNLTDTSNEDVITAAGIWATEELYKSKKWDFILQKIVASTGGSELKFGESKNDAGTRFNEFWSGCTVKSETPWYKKDCVSYGDHRYNLYLAFSKKPLLIKYISDETIQHPKAWDD